MKRQGRHAVPLLALVLVAPACASKPPPPQPTAQPAASAEAQPVVVVPQEIDGGQIAPPPAPKSDRDPRPLLAPYRVGNDKVARTILYTWTTQAQIDELQRIRVLLTRTESPTKGASYYDQVLVQRATDPKNKLAKLLRSQGFLRARFAWTSPWPTRLGWPGESYGESLISVTLKPESWFVKMRTSSPDFEVVDMQDRPVPLATVLKDPGRIAAIYFVNDATSTRPEDTPDRWAFREYVLCNEAMIADWSTGTSREKDAIDRSVEAINALAEATLPEIKEDALTWNQRVAKTWAREPAPDADPIDIYTSALSAPNQLYWPVKPELQSIAKALSETKYSVSVKHVPNAKFVKGMAVMPASPSASSSSRPVSRPRVPRNGTF